MSIAKENSEVTLQQAAPEQEPVAYFNMAINETVGCIAYEYGKHGLKSGVPLYAAPVDIEALTKERDEYKQRMQRLIRTQFETAKERDALMQAAKLALDAMDLVSYSVVNGAITADVQVFLKAKSALRQAEVQ